MSTRVDVAGVSADGLSLAYGSRTVVRQVHADLPAGQITAIVGANGCGKSTLLRGLARLMSPREGRVLLDGEDIARTPARELARRIGLLPQQPVAPDGITVADLVARGRHPHQTWFRQWSAADDDAVLAAMSATSVADLADVPIDELSGGQRQRVWIALSLAQEPQVMLLDEPTSFLDLAHQVEVLELLSSLNRRLGRTVVMVLHDLNMAARYADSLVMMSAGRIVHQGPPEQVVTTESVQEVFGLQTVIVPDPVVGTPLVVPHGTRSSSPAGESTP